MTKIKKPIGRIPIDEYQREIEEFIEETREDYPVLDSLKLVEDQEFIKVVTDDEDKVLEGINKDGTKIINGDTQIEGNATIKGGTTIKGDATMLGKIDIHGATYTLMQNPEWVKVLTDAQGRIIAGVREDGSVYIGQLEGLDNKLQEMLTQMQYMLDEVEEEIDAKIAVFNSIFSTVDNQEYIAVETDSENKVLSGRKADGSKFENLPVEFKDDVSIKNLKVNGTDITDNVEAIDANTLIEDPEGRTEIKTDSGGKIISYRDKKGIKQELVGLNAPLNLDKKNTKTLYEQLQKVGYNFMDWSNANSLKINTPRLAYINFIVIGGWPESKTENKKAEIEFYDMQGNYFRKFIIFNAQGASSMGHTKKNGSIDLFVSEQDVDNELVGEDAETFVLKIGDWVAQDSFHVKAYWSDRFKCLNPCNYKLYKQITDTRGIYADRIWKRALLDFSELTPNLDDTGSQFGDFQYDNGALCHPDGFPCIISLNGEFYGVYSFQLKKHRDNYRMDKGEAKHIHLDINSSNANLWHTGAIDWTFGGSMKALEVRNPKNMYYKELHLINGKYTLKYDGDYAYEIAGADDIADWQQNGVPNKIVDGQVVRKPWSDFSSKDQKNMQKTATVKGYIQGLHDSLDTLYAAEAVYLESEKTAEGLATLKGVFETYYDKDSILDYIITIDAIGARDVINNNVQWLTYNGTKWYASVYDLDGCFGQGVGNTDAGPFNVHITSIENYRNPIPLFATYYTAELEARYAELADAGILSVDSIFNRIKDWYDAVGSGNYELEAGRWPEEGSPTDNIYRLHKYIEVQLSNMDTLYHYTRN